jgi:hypothetical protein
MQKQKKGQQPDFNNHIKQGVKKMAKNTGDSHRDGSVKDRSQSYNSKTDSWVKRDTETGQFIDQKSDGKPFKGVAKEKDGRRK